ncbi:AAA family ATPase [Pedobacter sp. KR3-3]|uniref:AAA family ATPase n=1 Tax=Pedobacter albus TaxID=3113905 RepID=A0ABU7I668_9SPHI|nr:AAA family ATPase [Pedobacter sp. KR3-3]MEE1944933.1 AAA family ATPase [Pedobacter sp. KR3-3]
MKLHIFGASGSGVTTLGQALAKQLDIPYLDSDDFFWEVSSPPFTIKRNQALRNEMVQQAYRQTKHWVLGGSIINWGENVFPPFDLIVFLCLPPAIRLERLKARELERYGDVIISNPQRASQFSEFMAWATDYDHATGLANRTLKAHENWLGKQTSPVLEIRGDYSIEQKLAMVGKKLEKLHP